MLVLTRKRQEQIHIGDDIVLTVLRVKGNTVRVGIEAPRNVRVLRGELPPKEEREVELVINGESSDAFGTDDSATTESGSTEETIGETEGLRLVRPNRESVELAEAV